MGIQQNNTIKLLIIIACGIFYLLIVSACFKINNYNHHLHKKAHGGFRFATYNINWGNGLRSIKQPHKTLQAIINTEADTVFLQETTAYWEKKIKRSSLTKIYPYIEFKHYPKAGGLAILSKYPFHTTHYHEPSFGWHPFWIIKLKSNLGELILVNVHLTPPLVAEGNLGFLASGVLTSQPIRKREAKIIIQHLNTHKAIIIAGDFNEGDIGRAVNYFQKLGYQDAIKRSGTKHITWEWQAGPLNFHDRFDRVFYTSKLKLINLQILHQGDSDHYPVIADFKKNR